MSRSNTNLHTKKLDLNSVLMKASWKKLNANSIACSPQSSSSIIYAKIVASMILVLHDSHSVRWELHSTSHHAGNEMRLVTYFWAVSHLSHPSQWNHPSGHQSHHRYPSYFCHLSHLLVIPVILVMAVIPFINVIPVILVIPFILVIPVILVILVTPASHLSCPSHTSHPSQPCY